MRMANAIRVLVYFCLRAVCATVWRLCVEADFPSDKTFVFGPITTCSDLFCRIHVRTCGSAPILILCFLIFFALVIRIKWNLSLRLYFYEIMVWWNQPGTWWHCLHCLSNLLCSFCYFVNYFVIIVSSILVLHLSVFSKCIWPMSQSRKNFFLNK